MLGDLDLNELKWDHDGSYWYSHDGYNITPADMHEYARKLDTENARLLGLLAIEKGCGDCWKGESCGSDCHMNEVLEGE